ncbi:hypothetical protein AVO45_09130 [Ruegeria marisrubri]|uniref:Uncharacterized protein n=2 Tax=Ruegeria marisrubri TaxID=1685379 RepID=A0A0X3TST8_9RHOB|nr:hypothetical protein AVO45_09130 [Ruegeria marisrubri]
MGGTGGLVGTVTAFVTAPATIIAGAVLAAGVAAYEGACYFTDERITEYDEVLAVMQKVAENANPEMFEVSMNNGSGGAEIIIRGAEGYDKYDVKNLYIVNGVLMHRDWFRNTTVASLTLVVPMEN